MDVPTSKSLKNYILEQKIFIFLSLFLQIGLFKGGKKDEEFIFFFYRYPYPCTPQKLNSETKKFNFSKCGLFIIFLDAPTRTHVNPENYILKRKISFL